MAKPELVFDEMRIFFVLLLAVCFTALPLFAKGTKSLRQKRLETEQKTKYKIDPKVENKATVPEVVVKERKRKEPDPNKSVRSETSYDKTVRADKTGKSAVLKPAPVARKRTNTHFREWP